MAQGEFALVENYLKLAFQQPGGTLMVGDHDLYAMQADAAARRHDAVALSRAAPPAEEHARRHGHRLYQGIAHRAWGVAHRLAGRYAEAERRLNQAVQVFQEMDTRWQNGLTVMELGETTLAQGDAAGGRRRFARALAAFESLGAGPDAARARARLDLSS